ncbi:MAG: 4'-phosphopantetheinyl transferase superfamily protein [Pirellulales bacterium]|nr:4'-phosphopantetheinyl transferase superfamily protein [Pirellulales bacterium]
MTQGRTIEEWLPPPGDMRLGADDVHLWMSSIDLSSDVTRALAKWLSRDERGRAERFRHDVHRDRFIAGRAMMRGVLANYVDADPGDIEFEYLAHGKPRFAGAAEGVEFNLSHSGDVALLAVNAGAAIGVDVERIRELRDMHGLANRFFAPSEAVQIENEREDRRIESFFRCWTRKEAYVKAIGEGITCALDSFEVSIARESPARLVHIDQDETIAADWSMVSIVPAAQYVGALATRKKLGAVHSWLWDAESHAPR